MKPLIIPTHEQLAKNFQIADTLQSGSVFSTLPEGRRAYWQKVLYICVLLNKLPSRKIFEKWMLTNYFPHTYLWGTAIRKLFAFNGYASNFRYHVDEMGFPLPQRTELSEAQMRWIKANSSFDKVNQSTTSK